MGRMPLCYNSSDARGLVTDGVSPPLVERPRINYEDDASLAPAIPARYDEKSTLPRVEGVLGQNGAFGWAARAQDCARRAHAR